MLYKALILDVDGTTVANNSTARPTKKVIDAISKAKQRLHVSLSTSRPLFMVRDLIEELQLHDPCAITDATQIYDPVKKSLIQTLYINTDQLPKILSVLKSKKLKFLINDGNREFEYKREKLHDKICVFAIPDIKIKDADSLIEEVTRIPNISAMKVSSYIKGRVWVSITHPQATKLHSVHTITGLLGVKPEETIGIGDGYNDYPLLSACGLKIAMGNAVPELKAIADFIAPTVEEDGVATVIEKFILD